MSNESLRLLLQEGLTDSCLLFRISFTLLTHSLHCVLLQAGSTQCHQPDVLVSTFFSAGVARGESA